MDPGPRSPVSGWWYAVKYARGRALSRASRNARARDRVASVRPCRSRVWGVGGSLSRVSLARDSRVATLSPLHSRGSSRSTSILDERRPRADAPRATARPAPRRDQPGAPAGRGRGAPPAAAHGHANTDRDRLGPHRHRQPRRDTRDTTSRRVPVYELRLALPGPLGYTYSTE